MKTKVLSLCLTLILWAPPTWAQSAEPNVGPVNCLASWSPSTLDANNIPIPAGTVVTYRLYLQTTLTPPPTPGPAAAVWTGTTPSADCNLPGWAPGFMIKTLAATAIPIGQLYAWVTASAGGAESALSDPFPFMWLMAAPPPPSPPPPVPAKVTGLTVK